MTDYNATENRDQPRPGRNPSHRAKRKKYTAVACDECRKRKLKCIPGETQDCCQRCRSRGRDSCGYKALRRATADDQTESTDDQSVVSALSRDVKILRDTMNKWMATAGRSGSAEKQDERPEAASSVPRNFSSRHARSDTPGSVILAAETSTSTPAIDDTVRTASSHSSRKAPEEPRFIGPTRSAYSIEVGEKALSRMGIPDLEMLLPSRQQSPVRSPSPQNLNRDEQFWQRCDPAEFRRLVTVFQEEVESVYPCFDTDYLVEHGPEILMLVILDEDAAQEAVDAGRSGITLKDVQLAKAAIATAIVIEGHGKSEESTMVADSVERKALNILGPSRDLKDLQLLILLSIYYFHSDEDLLAWRTIGLAAREALVMGFHRKTTLLETFTNQKQRELAIRVFWTIYVLDRRWSFGTSLSFALVDRDIDPELPEPGPNYLYLKCMVGYGRLCSTLWDALVPFGHRTVDNPEEMTTELDIKTQEWLESIPVHLCLRHPRLGLAARAQPPVLQRLRALLYLRGNHARILIYRYYLLGPNRIKSFPRNASLAVEIAQDSIQVLVHLNDSSDIYSRQQAAFNYFLLNALAVIFLAVCNDPETFAAPCKKSLHSAIDLLRHFSRHSRGSRRLWSSVRGILPRLRRLEMCKTGGGPRTDNVLPRNDAGKGVERLGDSTASGSNSDKRALGEFVPSGPEGPSTMFEATGAGFDGQAGTPGFTNMTDELIGLFGTFEQGQHLLPQENAPYSYDERMYALNFLSEDQGEISWQFNWLIQ